jgi:ATP-dependent RNA helicase RhlE
MTFNDLNIIEPITKALSKKGYTLPTPIQQKAIPHLLEGKDVFGCAQTGTGKTAAFAIPILQLLFNSRSFRARNSGIKALILAPTRELALQIDENIATYNANLGLKHAVIFGGVSQENQVRALKNGIDILTATPGRLLDLMSQGFVKLDAIEFFVLDEADRMLDMGFINDIRKIIAKLPSKRQTMFFTATVPDEIRDLANSLLHHPVPVNAAPVSTAAASVKQSVYYVEKTDKRELLKHLLKEEDIDHVLVFTRTKRGADGVAKDLNRSGIRAEAIHGDKSQGARQRALSGFKSRTIRVLVATDIAARGIDVDKLSHVINYELPEQAETYVHRIGRTGRAGADGIALSFCTTEEREYLKDINKLLKNNIAIVNDHPYRSAGVVTGEPAEQKAPVQKARSPKPFNRRRGGNGSGKQQESRKY